MPAQQGTKFNFNSSLKKHAGDDIQPKRDLTELPGGITGGTARLVTLALGTYKSGPNQGKPFFRAAASVVTPKTADKVTRKWDPKANSGKGGVVEVSREKMAVEGLFTSFMIPLCDSKHMGKDVDADYQVARMIQELKLIGGKECTEGVQDDAGLNELFETLTSQDPPIHVKFTTKDRMPNAANPDSNGTWDHEWFGAVEAVPDDEPMQDDTSGSAESNGQVHEEPAGDTEVPGAHELDELVEKADDPKVMDEDARQRLTDIALGLGIEQDEIDAAETFADVRALIDEKTGSSEEQEPEKPKVPAKGDLYGYRVRDAKGNPIRNPKTKQPAKPIQVEITASNTKQKTVAFKSSDDPKKVFKDVPWDHLEDVPE